MKRDVLVCSMLAFVALTCVDVKGMVRGQDLTLDNSLEQARMYWNEIARLGGNPEEIMGIYRQGVYFDSLLPAFRETIEEAFRTITRLQEQNRDNQQRQNFPQAPQHDREQRPNVQNDIAPRNVQGPNVQNDIALRNVQRQRNEPAQGGTITIQAGTGIQPVSGTYNGIESVYGPRSLQGQRDHFTCYQTSIGVPLSVACIPNTVLAHEYGTFSPQMILFSANIVSINSARAIANLCEAPQNNIPNNFTLTIEEAATASANGMMLLRPQWAFLRNYVNRYGEAGAYAPGIQATCRVRIVNSDGSIIDPWGEARTEHYRLHNQGGEAVTASPPNSGQLGIMTNNESRAIIYTVDIPEVSENGQVIYPAHTEVGVILLYDDLQVAILSSLEDGADLRQLISSIPENLRPRAVEPIFAPLLENNNNQREENAPVLEQVIQLNLQNITARNSFDQVWLRRLELERLGMNTRDVERLFGRYRYGVAFDLLLQDFRLVCAAADAEMRRLNNLQENLIRWLQDQDHQGNENRIQPQAPLPQLGIANEPQNGQQLVYAQNQEYHAVLAQAQAAEQAERNRIMPRLREMMARLADLQRFRENAGQQDELPTPQSMLASLSDQQLEAIGCRQRQNIQRQELIQRFAQVMFRNFMRAVRQRDPRESQFFSILSDLDGIYQNNRGGEGTESVRILINRWVDALRNWCMTHEIAPDYLNRLRETVEGLPEEILSRDIRLILIGADHEHPGVIPEGRGIGHSNMSIFSWAELYPTVLRFEQERNRIEQAYEQRQRRVEQARERRQIEEELRPDMVAHLLDFLKFIPSKNQTELPTFQSMLDRLAPYRRRLLMFGNVAAIEEDDDAIRRQLQEANQENFIHRFNGNRFGEDSAQHQFFNILPILNNVYTQNAGSFNDDAENREIFVEDVSKLINGWVKNLQMWCLTHEVSRDDQRTLRQLAESLPQSILSRSARLVLLGPAANSNDVVPPESGIGHKNLPIFDWMRIYPVISAISEIEIGNQRSRFIQSILPEVDASQFILGMPDHDLSVLNMLSLKPAFIAPLLHIEDQNRTEKDLVRVFMPEIYEALRIHPHLLDCLIASSFGESFSIPIFSKFLAAGLPSLPQNQPPLLSTEAFILNILPLEMRNSSDKITEMRRSIERQTNINSRGLFGNIVLDVDDSHIYLPKLQFPILSINRELEDRIRANERHAQNLEQAYNAFIAARREFIRDADQVAADEYFNFEIIDNANVIFWTALRDAYEQDIRAGDQDYSRLRAIINARNGVFMNYVNAAAVYQRVVLGNDVPQLEDVIRIDMLENFTRRINELAQATRAVPLNLRNMTDEDLRARIPNNTEIKLYHAVKGYNKFAEALQSHINKFVSSEVIDADINESGASIEDLDSYQSDNPMFSKAKELHFVPSLTLFESWFQNFYNPTQPGTVGMLQYPPLLRNRDFFDQANGPAFLFLNPRSVVTSFNPYLGVHSKLLRFLTRIDPRLSSALTQQLYSLSFINMFEQPLMSTPGTSSFPFTIFEKAVTLMTGPRRTYTPTNDIGQIGNFSVVSNDRRLYDLSVIASFIPAADRELFNTHEKLSKQFLYWLLRGYYVAMTSDVNLEKRFDQDGSEAQNGTISFPNECPNLPKEEFRRWARNTIIDGLFRPMMEEMLRNPALISSHFKNLLSENGDYGHMVGNGNWYRFVLDGFYRSLTQNFKGLYNNVLDNLENQYGIYFNESLVQFIAYYLMQSVPHLDLSSQSSDTIITALGMLSSRYGHCQNGNVEGSLAAFLSFLSEFDPNIVTNFQTIMPMVTYIAAQKLVRDILDPEGREGHFYDINVLQKVLARKLVEALSSSHGVNLQRNEIISHGNELCAIYIPDRNFHDYELPFRELFRHSMQASYHDDNDAWTREVENWKNDFLRVFPNRTLPSRVQNAINAIQDESTRDIVQKCCDSFMSLGINNYQTAIGDVAIKALTPQKLVEWLLNQEALANMVFNAYKLHKNLDRRLTLQSLTPMNRQALLLDAFNDSGLFQGPARRNQGN